MDKILIRIIALGAALAAAGCATSDVQIASEELIVRNDRLFVTATINGFETEALLDSAAELTIVDARYAEEIGLMKTGSAIARGTGGEMEAAFVEGVAVEAVGVALENRTVAAIDLTDISQRLIGSPVKLIVGRDLFDAARLWVDIENGRIAAVGREKEPKGVRLEMESHRGLQTIPISIEGGPPVQADFDLGNGSEVLIGADYAARAGLSAPSRITGKKAGGGFGGEVMRSLVTLKVLDLAGVRFDDVPAAIDETPTAMDANVGVSILRNFRITVDYAEQTIWLDWTGL